MEILQWCLEHPEKAAEFVSALIGLLLALFGAVRELVLSRRRHGILLALVQGVEAGKRSDIKRFVQQIQKSELTARAGALLESYINTASPGRAERRLGGN
jgi:ABC-type nitrate/sulfonate/bicarbonate transport system substrate-binding protein